MPRVEKKRKTFDEHFGDIYGSRWPTLRSAMEAPHPKVALWNRHVALQKPSVDESGMVEHALASGLAYFRSADPALPELAPPPRDEHGVPAYYLLDLASVLVVEALAVEPFHRVLDLCAAPGGKSVAISQYLTVGASLTANEVNGERNKRLKRTLTEYVPVKNTHEVVVTQKDGTRWHQQMAFDRVLIDAPCSSERHLVSQEAGLASWSPKTTEEQAATQLTLVLRGLETLKVGGVLVYSTCSISPLENDGVVAKALERTRVAVEIVPTVLTGAEPTPLGASFHLPDTSNGMGPMYCAVLRRTGEHRPQSESDETESSGSDSGSD